MTGVVLLYLAVAIPYTLFVILYAAVSRPRSAIGRSLLLSKLVIAALAWNAVAALVFDDYPAREFVRTFIVGGAILAGWTQLALLIREQRASRSDQVTHTEESA
jgi:hypothetical protein